MKPFEKTIYLALAGIGAAAAVAVGFWKHNISYWAALLFFPIAVLYAFDRPVLAFRMPGFPVIPTKEDVIDIMENHMLWGDPEKRYASLTRSVTIAALLFGWGVVLYGALWGQPL